MTPSVPPPRPPRLADPIDLGPLRLKNRIVVSPMSVEYALRDGRASRRLVDYLAARAEGGAALVMTGFTFVDESGRGSDRQLGLADERHLAGWRRLAEAVQAAGAVLGAQLVHAGRNTVVPERIPGGPVAPSALAAAPGLPVPRALSRDEIGRLPGAFARAAARAHAAGAAVVEIHAAHGYLLNQFLSSAANRRDDEYGGDLTGRSRLLLEVVRAVREAAPGAALGVRLSADNGLPGGLDVEEAAWVAGRLVAEGIHYVSVSAGGEPPGWRAGSIRAYEPPGYLLPLARRVREAISTPVAAVGSLGYPEVAERVVAEGWADLVVVGRGHLADPAWARRALGREALPPRPCIRQNLCRQDYADGRPVRCAVNPELGREGREAARRIAPAPRTGPAARKARPAVVVVIGAGVRGMSAAARIAALGAHVALVDRAKEVGGRLALAASLPHKWELRAYLAHLTADLARHAVALRLGAPPAAPLSALDGREGRPWAVVWAVPERGEGPPPAGAHDTVASAIRRWVEGRAPAPERPVLVEGGSQAAADLAGHLAGEGRPVVLLAPGGADGVARDATQVTRRFLLEWLRTTGVAIVDASAGRLPLLRGEAAWRIADGLRAPRADAASAKQKARLWAEERGVVWIDIGRDPRGTVPGTIHAATQAAYRG
ncbi:MAG: NADH:flavin oxidoreductase, partial [Clostridia bacterium]|nr:NADH:flavin oxidoreductase [Clostridia bacterium]